MSAPEQPYLPMSVSNDVVVKRAASDASSSHQSSKEFAEQWLEPIRDNYYPEELCVFVVAQAELQQQIRLSSGKI